MDGATRKKLCDLHKAVLYARNHEASVLREAIAAIGDICRDCSGDGVKQYVDRLAACPTCNGDGRWRDG